MDNKKEQLIAVIFSIVGSLAILISLTIKGFTTEASLDAVKDLVGLLVTVAVFLLAYSISNKANSFSDVARAVLIRLQKDKPKILLGPRYNRDNYDPEKGQGLEYLFITNADSNNKRRVKFIPIKPLEEGVLAIYVQKGTLVYGLNYTSDEATTDEIKKIQTEVHKSVLALLKKEYNRYYEIITNVKDDTAIMIDFDETKLGKKKFAKSIEECVNQAIEIIQKYQRNNNVL